MKAVERMRPKIYEKNQSGKICVNQWLKSMKISGKKNTRSLQETAGKVMSAFQQITV